MKTNTNAPTDLKNAISAVNSALNECGYMAVLDENRRLVVIASKAGDDTRLYMLDNANEFMYLNRRIQYVLETFKHSTTGAPQ